VNFRRLYGQGTPQDFSRDFITFFSQGAGNLRPQERHQLPRLDHICAGAAE
jgi:hypothetical protein